MKKVNIGYDIGGMSLKAGLVDNEGNVIFKDKRKVTERGNGLLFDKKVVELAEKMIEYAKYNDLEIMGIGVGIPGTVNNDLCKIDVTTNLGINDHSLKYLKQYGYPVRLTNDANAATISEAKFGAAKGLKDVILLTLGTGIGGGVIANGQLYEGFEGKGTELGHLIVKTNGFKCGCGRRGCLEAYCSASGLMKLTKIEMRKNKNSMMWEYCKGNIKNVDGLTSFECAKKGDESANKVINEYVKYFGEGLLSLMNIFRPELIVIGGGISAQKEFLTDKLNAYCKEHLYGMRNYPAVKITYATSGNDAGLIGAAHLLPIE